MATRDVILRALQDWRRSGEAPLYLQSALNTHELGLLAEVAARAGAEETKRLAALVDAAVELRGALTEDQGPICPICAMVNRHVRGCEWPAFDAALNAFNPPPSVGTPAEADACAGRSGLGEVG